MNRFALTWHVCSSVGGTLCGDFPNKRRHLAASLACQIRWLICTVANNVCDQQLQQHIWRMMERESSADSYAAKFMCVIHSETLPRKRAKVFLVHNQEAKSSHEVSMWTWVGSIWEKQTEANLGSRLVPLRSRNASTCRAQTAFQMSTNGPNTLRGLSMIMEPRQLSKLKCRAFLCTP